MTRFRKWRCPHCGWYSVFQIFLGTKALDTFVCGNCSQVVNTNVIPNIPNKLTKSLPAVRPDTRE